MRRDYASFWRWKDGKLVQVCDRRALVHTTVKEKAAPASPSVKPLQSDIVYWISLICVVLFLGASIGYVGREAIHKCRPLHSPVRIKHSGTIDSTLIETVPSPAYIPPGREPMQ